MDYSITSEVIDAIKEVGFPIFVAVWLLMRSDKRTKELTEAIHQLRQVVERLK